MTMIILLCISFLVFGAYGAKNESCSNKFKLTGCYEERNPGTMLVNLRDTINWKDIVGSMRSMTCKCSEAAKTAGYSGFAIHFYGECYGRTESEIAALASKKHDENKCVGDQTYTKCDTSIHKFCTGKDWSEAIYTLESLSDPINGGWSSYGRYGPCSKTCGGGIQYHNRTCTNPAPANGGSNCVGSSTESASCNTLECPSIGFCRNTFTDYKKHLAGTIAQLADHPLVCKPNHVISAIRLQSFDSISRYNYYCCPLRGAGECGKWMQTKATPYSSHENASVIALGLHEINCGSTGFIKDVILENDSANATIHYRYSCCYLPLIWNSKVSCYMSQTAMKSVGNGKIQNLRQLNFSCMYKYALSYFQLKFDVSKTKMLYRYRCCKVKA